MSMTPAARAKREIALQARVARERDAFRHWNDEIYRRTFGTRAFDSAMTARDRARSRWADAERELAAL